MSKRVLVIGGVNTDIGAAPEKTMVPGDSNPGHIMTSLGGVGCNIARNLRLLGVDTALLTVLGDDAFGTAAMAQCKALGLDMALSEALPGQRSGTYLYVLNDCGDMVTAVNDMGIYRNMTPALLEKKRDEINRFDLVVLDTNPPRDTIEWLCDNCTVPIVADPVSIAKASKLQGVMDRLYAIKPNRMEAEFLSGMTIRTEADMEAAADALLAKGLRQICISLGADGIFAKGVSGEKARFYCPRVEVRNATGGGDAMVAALCAGILRGDDLAQCAGNAICAGAFAATAQSTIHPDMSWENIAKLRESEEIQHE